MADYRTVRMSFWHDPYTESLTVGQKLMYLYLFTGPHTNNLGLAEISERKIAFETGISSRDVSENLARFEADKKIVRDGQKIWLAKFIKHQTTTSEKLLIGLKKLVPEIGSAKIISAASILYPHIFDGVGYPMDTVSIPSAELEGEGEGESEGEGCAEPDDSTPQQVDPVVISIPLVGIGGKEGDVRQSDVDEWVKAFPGVDVMQALREVRAWNVANPTKQKTEAGYKKHIVSWLKKEQDKGPRLNMRPTTQYDSQFAGVI